MPGIERNFILKRNSTKFTAEEIVIGNKIHFSYITEKESEREKGRFQKKQI